MEGTRGVCRECGSPVRVAMELRQNGFEYAWLECTRAECFAQYLTRTVIVDPQAPDRRCELSVNSSRGPIST